MKKITDYEIATRLVAKTPTHFKRTRNIGLGMLIAGIAVKAIGVVFPPLLPISIISLASDFIGYGSVIAGISQTAKK